MKKGNSKRPTSKKVQRKQKLKQKTNSGFTKYADFLHIGIIVLLGILIYSNSFNCSFQFDDGGSIVNNEKIRDLLDVKSIWDYSKTRFIPIFTFAINYAFGGLNVWGYHFVNLLIHIINACLVYWLTLSIFKSPVLKDKSISKDKKLVAFATALLFASHPLATQSITYIVQRMASMVAMFYLLSILLYMKARLSTKSGSLNYLLYGGAAISGVLAMLTKENAFTLPFAIVLIELFFLQTKKLKVNLKDSRVILVLLAFLGFIVIVLTNFSFSVFDPIPPQLGHSYTVTPLNYLLTQFSVILKYIQLLFLPVNLNLDYDFPISNSLWELRTTASLLVLLSISTIGVLLFKKHRIISFGIFWFFLTLSIESSIIPITDLIFEHRTYLPSFGFVLILSFGLYKLLWQKNKYLPIAILLLIIGSNSIITYQRNKVWKDPLTLWTDAVSKSPNKARPLGSRGDSYRALKQWDNAIADYTSAILINPDYTIATLNRGIIYGDIGQWDKAMADYNQAIQADSNYILAYYNRGRRFNDLGQMDKAIADYSQVVRINPNYKLGFYNRGGVFGKLGQWDKAISDYDEAIRIDPRYKEAVFNCGHAYFNLGKLEESIIKYSDAIQIDPNFTKALYNRSVAFVRLGQWDRAISDCTRVIGIDPGYAAAYHNRGFAYDNMNQLELAIADYSKTLELDPNNANAKSSLQIALTKLGR